MAMIGQDPADAFPREEVGARDRAAHESVAQHGPQVAARRRQAERAEVPARRAAGQAHAVSRGAADQALKADAHRPKHERRTAQALFAQIKAAGLRRRLQPRHRLHPGLARRAQGKARRRRPSCR